MPYELPLPTALNQWKVKILDNELLYEEPHVTIRFKTEHWRFSLRSRQFLDKNPSPGQVPKELMTEVQAKIADLIKAWDARFPTNPVVEPEGEK
jgi:hypothetical protein